MKTYFQRDVVYSLLCQVGRFERFRLGPYILVLVSV